MPILTEKNRVEKGWRFIAANRKQRRIAGILSLPGRKERYKDLRKIMKVSVSWNKYVTYGTKSIL